MRRGVMPITGATIDRAGRTPCRKRPIAIRPRIDRFNRRVTGQTITSVDRLGKRLVLRLSSDDRIIFEPRMTGIVLLGQPPSQEHLRFELQLTDCQFERLLFWDRRGLGQITLLSVDQFERKVSDGSLGPDAISVDAREFRARGNRSTREIKVALLDQKFVAGVGNLYASEILHMAGVDPRARCHRLSVGQWESIHQCMLSVLKTAIKYEGSTLSDGTYQKALNDPGGYQNHHRVYDREGKRCPRCRGQTVKRIVQSQRSTFFCSHCQKR